MEITKKTLLEALEIVRPGLANKEIIDQATSFAFRNGKIITYNDEISISHPIAGLDIEGVIKAEKLYDLLKKIKREELTLTLKNNEVIIKSGRAYAGLPLESEIRFPFDVIKRKGQWQALNERFIKFLSLAMTSCSTDMSDPLLTCVHVTKNGYIESSDNYSATRCDLGEENPVNNFLLPATSADIVIRINPTKIVLNESFVHFKNDNGTEITCRIFEKDTFKGVSHLLDVKGKRVILPPKLSDMLDRATIFTEGDHKIEKSIDVVIEEGKFKISSRSTEGWFKEEGKITYDLDPIKLKVTPHLLKRIIKESGECIISKDKLKFEGDGWIYVVAQRK